MLSTRTAPAEHDEWRRVTVHGTWDDEHSVVLKYQTRDGGAGVDVVTPLVTSDGAAVLVDRGWMSTDELRRDAAQAAAGDRRHGHRHRVGTAGRDRRRDQGERPVDPGRLVRRDREVLPYPLYRGFLDLAAESPAPAKTLGAVELPDDTSNGPHFFYGLQWWFFGALAIFGFCYLVWDELRQRRTPREQGPAVTAPGACRRPRAASPR